MYKTLIKELKEDLNKCRDILCSLIGKLRNFKMSVFPNLTFGFNVISIKIPENFVDVSKLIKGLSGKEKDSE